MSPSSLVVAFFAAAGSAFAQCEAPAPVSHLLRSTAFDRKMVERQSEIDARAAAFRDALAQFPDNYLILRRELQVSYFDQPEERVRLARELHARHPGSPMLELLEAFALAGKDTPQAIRRMEAVKAAHPEIERVYIELASLFLAARFKDKSRVQKELAGYLKLCPQSIDASFLSQVSDSGTPDQVAQAAVVLRKRLETDAGDPQPGQWETLWRLEFKAHPLAEHAMVRRQVAGDLARFEKSPRRQEVAWMVFLRNGYQSMGDAAAVDRMSDEILETHPESPEARSTVQQRWRKEHDDKDTRAHLAAAREWHQRWPTDANILYMIFGDLAELPDTPAEQIATAVDEFQAAYRKNADFRTTPPIEFRIAEAYVKHKIRLDQVPALVETGYRDAARRFARFLEDDREAESTLRAFHDALDSMRIQAAGMLLDCYALTKEPGKPVEATESRWERPQNPMPAFALPDLNGKTWKLARLEGKTLLVNIWASWCGPCKAEHPEFQKLYNQLKDRPDVTVLSFNVDEDLGKVAPYIAENHFTFPVIPAKDVVDAVVPALAIPRNWLVDAKGKLEWEQIGFGADPQWQERMLAKLEEVIRGGK